MSYGEEGSHGEGLDHAAVELRNSLMRIARRLRAQRPPGELTLGAMAVLGRLDRDGPATASELAAAERVTPQSMARPVARLVDLGLVERRPDPADGRQTLLHPTGRGVEFLRADRERRDVWLARAMATHLNDVERDLLRLTTRLLDRLATAPDDAEPEPPDRSSGPPPPSPTRPEKDHPGAPLQ
ncbi:MarR family winged helix-turn-helix transcriptional regulator [Streptomyces sclerotialus]|uniref:MarR family winged helix-turn-helix transcriptional regulator n=1 Tax=Streptomyces sclerotialus TaxID=1957 RepID=UPI0007C4B9CF